jgi:hypothetical protein
MKLEKLKRLIIGRISVLIAENSLDYSSDYKEEMRELDNLKDILEFGNEVWKSVHWSLGSFSPLPPLFEEGEWLKQYARTLVDSFIDKEIELKGISRDLSEEKIKSESLQGNLSSEREKLTDLEVKNEKLEQQVASFSKNVKNILEPEIKSLVADLENKENLNIKNYSHNIVNDIRKELREIEIRIEGKKEHYSDYLALKELKEKTDQISREQNIFIDKLLVEKQQGYETKIIILSTLLIGLLILTVFKLTNFKKKKKKQGGVSEWFKEVVLKTTNTRVFKGSNPFASSIL